MKKLHYNTVSKTLTKYLRELMNEPLIKDFVLVGGTSLSLQLGHRVSIDIDLFTDSPYGSVNFNAIQEMLRGKFNFCNTLLLYKKQFPHFCSCGKFNS